MDLYYQRIFESMRGSDVRPSSSTDEYFIFCVGQSREERERFETWAAERDIGVKSLIGSYKGTLEYSYIANRKDYETLERWFSAQESVLMLGPRQYQVREASIAYLPTQYKGPRQEAVGQLTAVPYHEAMQYDSWTFDPFTKQYFVCK